MASSRMALRRLLGESTRERVPSHHPLRPPTRPAEAWGRHSAAYALRPAEGLCRRGGLGCDGIQRRGQPRAAARARQAGGAPMR